MASDAANADGSLDARRRRIDEVRQLQQQRRRQALESASAPHPAPQQPQQLQQHQEYQPQHCHHPQHQEKNTSSAISQDEHSRQHQPQGGHQSDGDAPPPTPARSAASSRASSSTRSTTVRSRMSAKRQNMMARRIEMRQRREEEARLREKEARLREHQQPQAVSAPINTHGNDLSQPQHLGYSPQSKAPHLQPEPMPHRRFPGQSILKNAGDSDDMAYHSTQQQQHSSQKQHRHPQNVSPRDGYSPQDGQHRYDYDQSLGRQHQHSEPPSGNYDMTYQSSQQQNLRSRAPQDGRQQYQRQNQAQQRQQQQQYHQSQNISYDHIQSRPQQQRSRTRIPFPPMLQWRQQFSQIPVHNVGAEVGEEAGGGDLNLPRESASPAQPQHLSHAGRALNQGVYNVAELERSGIIRNDGFPHALQNTNRLKRTPYDSPSDEWFGLNHHMQPQSGHVQHQLPQQLVVGNQYHWMQRPAQHEQIQQQAVRNQQEQPTRRRSQHEQQLQPQQSQQLQFQHQRSQQPHRYIESGNRNAVGHYGMLKNASMVEFNAPRSGFSQDRQESHRPQLNQRHLQHQDQNGPDWDDVDLKYHEDNRQRFHQRQLASRQQQSQQKLPQQQRVQPHSDQQHAPSKSPKRPSRISTMSPVEHLGNRAEQIQRKNNGKLRFRNQNQVNPTTASEARRQSQQPLPILQPNSRGTEGGDDGILSVSDQARRFEDASVVRGNTHLVKSYNSSNVDEETVSVASLRKGWEGKPRAKSAPRSIRHPPQSSPIGSVASSQHGEGSAFGVWEERANRLVRVRRREQRREQRKNIEDRWRRNAARSLPPEKRNNGQQRQRGDDGYQSEGHARRSDLHGGPEYQSEPPTRRRGHGRAVHGDYHNGYQSKGREEGQEIEYKGTLDSEPTTVEDARRRLWDQKERLRVVLPAKGSEEIEDVRGRWPEEKPQTPPTGSPSNFSGSSGGLFKSKFVHAATLVTRDCADREQQQQQPYQRLPIMEENGKHEQQEQECDYKDRRNCWAHVSEEEEMQERARRRGYEERQNLPRRMQQRMQNQQNARRAYQIQAQQELNLKKGYLQKVEGAETSHYTDSTAETTDITTTVGSHGSTYLRKVSLLPEKRNAPQQPAASSTMPPIAEQQTAPPQTLQTTQSNSVADLIARINAVSRSNPEEALAAIDSILKRESNGNVGSVRSQFVCGDIDRVSTPQKFSHGDTPPPSAAGPSPSLPPAKTNKISLFSPTRPDTAFPLNKTAKKTREDFQENYEEVLRVDSERVIHGSANDDDVDMDGDSLMSSSEESTVSSMTNPTYQSLRSEPLFELRRKSPNQTTELPQNIRRKDQKALRKNQIEPSQLKQTSQQQQTLPAKPQKSWHTLRREYVQRKTLPPSNSAEQGDNVAKAQTESNDIAVDEFEFNPDDIEIELEQCDHRQKQQLLTISKDGTDDFNTGFCGLNYRKARPSPENKGGTRERNDADVPPTTSTLTDSAWVSMPSKGNAFTMNALGKSNHLDLPALMDQRSNTRAMQHDGNDKPRTKGVRSNTAAQPSWNMNVPKHTQHSGNGRPKQRTTIPAASEVMKTVSDAFSDVDISLEGGQNNREEHARRLIQQTREPLMMDKEYSDIDQRLQSLDELDQQASSLQTVSESFSDVDVSFDKGKKTVSQRRKELEYLANAWSKRKSQSQDIGSSTTDGGSSAWTQSRVTAKAASRANKPQKTTTSTKKRLGEPTLRLKGNKSLAQKFASLVNAYDD